MINRWIVGLAAAAVALPVAAESVNVYSARHYDTDDRLYEMFTEQTGIEVKVLEGNSDELIQRIKREGDASPADIMMTVDAGRLWRAEDEGIFQSTESEVLDRRIPDIPMACGTASANACAWCSTTRKTSIRTPSKPTRTSPTTASRGRSASAPHRTSTTSRWSPR